MTTNTTIISLIPFFSRHYTALAKTRGRVNVETPMIQFDVETIEAEGYNVTTPVIVIISDEYGDLIAVTNQRSKHTIIKLK